MKKIYKYQIVSEQKQPQGHMLYLLRYKADNGAKSEYWVGQSRLRRFYEQGRLTDKISDHVKEVVTAKPIKPVPRGKVKLTPRMEGDGPVYSAPKKWSLPDEFKVEPTGKAYIFEKDGRWCVMMPDGTLDEDTYPDKEWAQSEADSLNNS